ncbi:hypothetical protein DMUE_1782 [Dictyocoela muelleri]|nr:hypothetical protein DMUE_1782 [Dictyocoela muelleri]
MFINNNEETNHNEINNHQDIFETEESVPHNINRKIRLPLTKVLIECDLGLLQREISLAEMTRILYISYITAKRLYKRYLGGGFQDLSKFKTRGKKKSVTKKGFCF